MNKELRSALQETLRTTALAVVAILLTQVQRGMFDYRELLLAVLIGVLRGVERYLHQIKPNNTISNVLEFNKLD